MKQFLCVVDESAVALLSGLLGANIRFLEVQGLDVKEHPALKILVTPVAAVETPIDTPEAQ